MQVEQFNKILEARLEKLAAVDFDNHPYKNSTIPTQEIFKEMCSTLLLFPQSGMKIPFNDLLERLVILEWGARVSVVFNHSASQNRLPIRSRLRRTTSEEKDAKIAKGSQLTVQYRIEKTRTVLGAKAAEYATADRLHNFKKSASFLQSTSMAALVGMLVKHLVSIDDLLEKITGYVDVPLPLNIFEMLDEKFGDAICYTILAEAITFENDEIVSELSK